MAARQKTRLGIAFGKVLAEERDNCGLTQEALADKIHYSRVQIGYLETGLREPSLEALIKLEAALGLAAGELTRKTTAVLKKPGHH